MEYEKAAVLYRNAKCYEKAIAAYKKAAEAHTKSSLPASAAKYHSLITPYHTLLQEFHFLFLFLRKYMILFRSYETAALLAREARTQNPQLLQEAVELSLKFSFFSFSCSFKLNTENLTLFHFQF
jgi:tetratricopeptide (TPR) repeat protein